MAKSFASRTAAGGRLFFGTNRTKWLKALVHWRQDFHRISDTPTIVGLTEVTEKNLADLFTKVLTAARRAFLLERFTY